MRCSDDELDALSLWFKQHTRPTGRCMIAPSVVGSEYKMWENEKCTLEDNMRFEIKEVKGEPINAIYPDVWTIKDNYGENSPVDKYRANKKCAEELCEWLNENIKEIPFKWRVKKVISELWDDDEIVVDECMGYTAVTEIKETCLTSSDILAKLDNCDVETHNICSGKSVFKISEEKE